MKSFIISLIVFAVVISAVTLNVFYISKITKELIDIVSELPNEAKDGSLIYDENPQFAHLVKRWNENEFFISITVGNKEAENVNSILIKMIEYYGAGDTPNYRAARSMLLYSLHLIQTEEQLSIEGIL